MAGDTSAAVMPSSVGGTVAGSSAQIGFAAAAAAVHPRAGVPPSAVLDTVNVMCRVAAAARERHRADRGAGRIDATVPKSLHLDQSIPR